MTSPFLFPKALMVILLILLLLVVLLRIKLRNRLLPLAHEKLTYIKMNYRVAHPDIKAEANMFDSDAEDPVDYDFEPSESDDGAEL